jgi:hypothetical protein
MSTGAGIEGVTLIVHRLIARVGRHVARKYRIELPWCLKLVKEAEDARLLVARP